MNSHISSRTSSFSAPVVQSRLEHHHQQQMLKQPEIRNHHQHHQRSKSLNNKGKRGVSYNYQQKIKETNNINSLSSSSSSSSTKTTTYSRVIGNKNFSNYSNNFDSSYHHVGCNNNNNSSLLIENASVGQLQRKSSTSNKPPRRHQYSDSIDEDKFRVKNISILKRPQSATDFVKSSSSSSPPSSKSSSSSSSSLDVTREEQSNHHRSNKVAEKSTQRSQSKERRRSDVTPRSKKAQRKEIKSMELETDLILNVTTSTTIQQLSVSSDESDVNSNKYVKSVSSSFHYNNTTTTTNNNNTTTTKTNAVIFPPLNYSNAIIALEEGMNSNKKEDAYSVNSDDNITVKSNKKRSEHYVETTPRRLSGTAIELQVSRFADSDSESSLHRLGVAKLYAGPTFHNSPAPSDLPMPSFYSKSLGKEPSPLSTMGNNLFTVPEFSSPPSLVDNYSSPSSGNTSDDDMFSMDDIEPISNSRQYQTAAAYMVPERMATAHNPMQVYPTNDLNEISETLRSLLKIHGQ